MKTQPLSDVIPYRQLDEGAVDLRGEGVLEGYWMVGPPPDSCPPQELLARCEHLARTTVHCRTGDSIQVIFDRKLAKAPELLNYAHPVAERVAREAYERFADEEHWITPSRLYLSHQYAAPMTRFIKSMTLTHNGPDQLRDNDLLRQHALGRFRSFTEAARNWVTLRRMTDSEIFNDLLHCITYREEPADLPARHVRLNKVMAYERQINGQYPMIRGWHLRPIVITQYPSATLPQMLSILLNYPGYLTLSIRFRCWSQQDAERALDKEKPAIQQTFLGDFTRMFKRMIGSKRENDDGAWKQMAEVDEAIADARNGACWGTVQSIVIVRDRDPERADEQVHELSGALAGKGILARVETIGAEKAIRNTWPGCLMLRKDEHQAHRHRIKFTATNFWDVALPRQLWEGMPTIDSSLYPAGTPTPFVCSGTAGEPFYYPTHANGVAHFLGIGTTGSGKTTWEHSFIAALHGIPNIGRIVLLDSSVAKASFVFAHLLDAEYHEVGAQDSLPLCPLAMLDKPHGLQWLMGWFERLFYRRNSFELDERGSKDLMEALRDVRMRKNHPTTADGQGRNLLDLYAAIDGGEPQRNRIRKILEEMRESYGHIFGGNPAPENDNIFSVYQLNGLSDVPKYISTPAKELILHSIIVNLDGRPSWVIWDEFWDAVGDDTSAAWLFQSLRTMRGLNCGFGGLTQTSTEITESPHCNVMLGLMPHRLFFPDKSVTNSYIRQSLNKLEVSDYEIARIAGAEPGDFFYKSFLGARLASNRLGDTGKAICARTSYADTNEAAKILRTCADRDEFVSRWLTACGLPDISTGQTPDGRRSRVVAA